MTTFVGTYSPSSVQFIMNNYQVKDFAEDTFISIQPNSKNFRQVRGIRGKSTTVKTRDRSGIISIRILQTSVENELLTKISRLDEANQTGLLTITIRDTSGQSVYQFQGCRLEGSPTVEFTGSTQAREWNILYDRAVDYYLAGNKVAPLDMLLNLI